MRKQGKVVKLLDAKYRDLWGKLCPGLQDFLSCAGDGLVFYKSTTVLPAFSIAGLEYIVDIEENMKHQTANHHGVEFFYGSRKRVDNPVERDV